jgi:hypothetical protein
MNDGAMETLRERFSEGKISWDELLGMTKTDCVEKQTTRRRLWKKDVGCVSSFSADSNAIHRKNAIALNALDYVSAGNGSLNPTWVEWLMGFPIGWTDLEDSETP